MSRSESILEWLKRFATGELRDADMVLATWRRDGPGARHAPPVDIERIMTWLGMKYTATAFQRRRTRLDNAAIIGHEFGLNPNLLAAFAARLLVNAADLPRVLNGQLTNGKRVSILDIDELANIFDVENTIMLYRLKQLGLR
jgi:hypothetical protein